MTDILSDLKRVSRCVFKDGWESADLHARAGIEIAMLRARIAELQTAAPAPNVTVAIAGRRDLSHVDLEFLVSAVDKFIAAKSDTNGDLGDAFRWLCGARFALSVPSITDEEISGADNRDACGPQLSPTPPCGTLSCSDLALAYCRSTAADYQNNGNDSTPPATNVGTNLRYEYDPIAGKMRYFGSSAPNGWQGDKDPCGWQPIEDMPAHGSKIDVLSHDGKVVQVHANPEARSEFKRHYVSWRPSKAAPTPASNLGGGIDRFERAYPELYWHVAKGKISAGEPLYGAAIFTGGNTEMGHGESDESAEEAFRIAVDDAGLTLISLGASFETAAEAYLLDEAKPVAGIHWTAADISKAFLAGAKFGRMRAANEFLASQSVQAPQNNKRRSQQMYLKGFRQARELAVEVIETVDTADRGLLVNALRAIHPPTKVAKKRGLETP